MVSLCCSDKDKAKMIDILTRMQNKVGDGESEEEGPEEEESFEERLAKIALSGWRVGPCEICQSLYLVCLLLLKMLIQGSYGSI